MVCFFTYYVLSHTHVTHVTHTFSLLYICITYVISKMISLHTVTHTYIHVTYIYTCRYVAKVDSVHCSPPTPNYINDKIYSCVQFLSSTSLTQTKKKYFCEPKLKKKKRMKLVNKQTSETKKCV